MYYSKHICLPVILASLVRNGAAVFSGWLSLSHQLLSFPFLFCYTFGSSLLSLPFHSDPDWPSLR